MALCKTFFTQHLIFLIVLEIILICCTNAKATSDVNFHRTIRSSQHGNAFGEETSDDGAASRKKSRINKVMMNLYGFPRSGRNDALGYGAVNDQQNKPIKPNTMRKLWRSALGLSVKREQNYLF